MKVVYMIVVSFLCLIFYPQLNIDQIKESRMNVVEFEKALEQKDIQLIDVRTLSEYKDGHLPNSTLIDVMDRDNFNKKIEALDKTKPTYLYCKAGVRSLWALKIMKKKGFVNVYDLKGGYTSWQKHHNNQKK